MAMTTYISLLPPARSAAHYCLDLDRGLKIEEYEGRTGLKDVRAVALRAFTDPDWSAEFSSLIDLEFATLELSSNDVLRVALTWRQTGCRSGGWTAFVVSPSASFGVVRMLGAWAWISGTMEIFTNRGKAERWLARQRVGGLAKVG